MAHRHESSHIESGLEIKSVKTCFVVSDSRLINAGLYRINGGFFGTDIGKEFIVAYLPYTSHYYAYDPETGREVATFTKEFYEENIKKFRKESLVPDKNCV